MTLFWPALALLVVAGGIAGFRRTRRAKREAALSDDDVAAIERGGELERPDPLDLEEIAEAERRHREQTWDLDESDAW